MNYSDNTNSKSSYDALILYDGNSNTAPIIGFYCGTLMPFNEISSTNKVLIHFYSDESFSFPGFKLEYQQYIA